MLNQAGSALAPARECLRLVGYDIAALYGVAIIKFRRAGFFNPVKTDALNNVDYLIQPGVRA
jgi:hypothetical protein